MKRPCGVFLLMQNALATGNLRGAGSTPESYDVIVVGGGLTGSIVAAKLAEQRADKQVLLLEAGEPSQRVLGGRKAPAHFQGGDWHHWQGDWKGLTRYDVPANYMSLNCWSPGCGGHSWPDLPVYQCKVLGGCGVMNGALGQIPRPGNFESWPEGWRHVELSPYYLEAQELFHYTPTPSTDGAHYLNDTGADVVRDVFAAAGFSDGNPIDARRGIMGVPFVSAKHGIRVSTASELLPDALLRHNFQMRVEALVQKIAHDNNGTATGVQLQSGEIIGLKPGGRVILTAGTWNTARLLLDSKLGNEAVGKGVSDHTHYCGFFQARQSPAKDVATFTYAPPPSSSLRDYLSAHGNGTTGNGPIAQFGPTFVAYIKDPTTDGDADGDFDVEVWVSPAHEVPNHNGYRPQLVMGMVLMRPTCSETNIYISNGTVLSSGDAHEGCDRDRQTIKYAEQFVTEQMSKAGFSGGFSAGDAMNHWAGSCKLGSCIDPSTLIVHNTNNVVVADASILPSQVWAHPTLTLQAMALKAADMISPQI